MAEINEPTIESVSTYSFDERYGSLHEWAVARGFAYVQSPNTPLQSYGKKIGWQERARILQKDYRFTPTTIEELNAAFFRKIAFENKVAGTAQHLQEVYLHQASNPELSEIDPIKAVRNVVHDIGAYYTDAKERRSYLLDTYEKLTQPINPELHITEVIQDEDLSLGGLLSVVQFQAVRTGIQKGDKTALQGGAKDTESGRRLVTTFDVATNDDITLQTFLENLPDKYARVGGFRKNILDAGRSHRNRMDIWFRALEESRAHLAARDVAEQYLPPEM